MQQNVFKRKLSVLFDTVNTKIVQYLEEKIQPIKQIVIENIQKKNRLKFEFYEIQIKTAMLEEQLFSISCSYYNHLTIMHRDILVSNGFRWCQMVSDFVRIHDLS